MNIRVSETLTETERHQLFEWGTDIFGIEQLALDWRRKDWHVFVEVDGSVVSHAGVVKDQSVTVGNEQLAVSGIGGVVTIPEARTRGYAREVVRGAISLIGNDPAIEFAMLFCREPLIDFYSQMDWIEVRSPVLIKQNVGVVPSPLRVMVKCMAEQEWPSGPVIVNGHPW